MFWSAMKEWHAFIKMWRLWVKRIGIVVLWLEAGLCIVRDNLPDVWHSAADFVIVSMGTGVCALVGLGVPFSRRLQSILLVEGSNWRDGWYGFLSFQVMAIGMLIGCVQILLGCTTWIVDLDHSEPGQGRQRGRQRGHH